MSAEFVDALKGYEYYLKERGEATIDDVNNYLITHGRTPIHARTYAHFRKLLAHGFRSYIPINQFDVFQALGKLQMAADRRRYQRDKVRLPAKISLDHENWKDAEVTDKSLVGFGATVFDKFLISKGTKIWLRLEDYQDIPIISVWRNYDQEKNNTIVGTRAFEFIANYRLTEEYQNFSRLTGVIQISREQEGIIEWEHIYRVLDKNNQLLDAVSALIYTINDALNSKIPVARPVLLSMKFGSPGELQTKVDFGVAEILKVLIEKFQFWSLDKQRYRQENQKRELENANSRVELARNLLHLHKEAEEAGMTDEIATALCEPIKNIFGVKTLPVGLLAEGTLERGVLTERIIPVVAELVDGDDPDFKLSVHKTNRDNNKITSQKHKRRRTKHAKNSKIL